MRKIHGLHSDASENEHSGVTEVRTKVRRRMGSFGVYMSQLRAMLVRNLLLKKRDKRKTTAVSIKMRLCILLFFFNMYFSDEIFLKL